MVLSEDNVLGYLIYERTIEAMFSQPTDHRGCVGVTLPLSADPIPSNPHVSISNTQKWCVKCNNQLSSLRYAQKVNNGYWSFIDNVYEAPLCTKSQALWWFKKKEESIIIDNENVSSLKGRQFYFREYPRNENNRLDPKLIMWIPRSDRMDDGAPVWVGWCGNISQEMIFLRVETKDRDLVGFEPPAPRQVHGTWWAVDICHWKGTYLTNTWVNQWMNGLIRELSRIVNFLIIGEKGVSSQPEKLQEYKYSGNLNSLQGHGAGHAATWGSCSHPHP